VIAADKPVLTGKRLIEDAIPIDVVSRTSASEKVGGRIGHPASLHLWWARRPLAASRAAVYAALVPANGHHRNPAELAEFFNSLCRWGGPESAIRKARQEVLAANGGQPPKVVDLFAGGGAIPLEAARLGCEVTANELNPVAHLIERMMLEYPQAYPGLAGDVRRWGKVWLDRAWDQLADLYPPIPSADAARRGDPDDLFGGSAGDGRTPLAYLWTRTVRCPNPALAEHRVDLVRQTWLGKKKGRVVALKPIVDRAALKVTYQVVEAPTADALGFDPGSGSARGQTACHICGATVTADYIKVEGRAGRIGTAPLCAVVLNPSSRRRDYLPAGKYHVPDDDECGRRLATLPVTPPDEPITPEVDTGIRVHLYGLYRFRDLFTPRQLLTLCTFASGVREVHDQMLSEGMDDGRAAAIVTALALVIDKVADYSTTLCRWAPAASAEKVNGTFARQALPMVWDFAEANPFGKSSGDAFKNVDDVAAALDRLSLIPSGRCVRGSATSLPLTDESQDAVITDPPYYDNIFYADLSDFFYVWLKRSVGFLYPEHLGGQVAPRRNEAVAAPYRHNGRRGEARAFYEQMMGAAFIEAHRVLKPGAPLVCVYAHKTTLGWATLVDALRTAGFTITEAWPLDTEMPERSRGQNSAALASSIFLVARKRAISAGVGGEAEVMAELDEIITERLKRLRDLGVVGSDLLIAIVGAGLRALTRYERVEQDNGELLPAERFLTVVQGRVLDAMFGSLAKADPVTRYYVAAQFSYGYAAVPFDEANNLAHMTGVDLDSPHGLTGGRNPLVLKHGSTVALRDFEDRGDDANLGVAVEGDGAVALLDVAHGLLWRAEHRPAELRAYLLDARPDSVLLQQVIQAMAGKALRSASDAARSREAAAAERLLISWRRLVEDTLFGP
jgi:putative DNA methylase